jgi:hypothetical protein
VYADDKGLLFPGVPYEDGLYRVFVPDDYTGPDPLENRSEAVKFGAKIEPIFDFYSEKPPEWIIYNGVEDIYCVGVGNHAICRKNGSFFVVETKNWKNTFSCWKYSVSSMSNGKCTDFTMKKPVSEELARFYLSMLDEEQLKYEFII